mmetsp:Transcript_9920/g.34786  ORF Transcript_9920/g.34786 Transcript_9920/m.34786 type:complete len:215 (+) Transcript_9920:1003-1647(+)
MQMSGASVTLKANDTPVSSAVKPIGKKKRLRSSCEGGMTSAGMTDAASSSPSAPSSPAASPPPSPPSPPSSTAASASAPSAASPMAAVRSRRLKPDMVVPNCPLSSCGVAASAGAAGEVTTAASTLAASMATASSTACCTASFAPSAPSCGRDPTQMAVVAASAMAEEMRQTVMKPRPPRADARIEPNRKPPISDADRCDIAFGRSSSVVTSTR